MTPLKRHFIPVGLKVLQFVFPEALEQLFQTEGHLPMQNNSFDLPPDLDPEWLTFLESLPIGTDEEDQLYNHNLKLIAAFIVAHKTDDPDPIIQTLAFRLARHKIEQILLDRTPHFLAFRSAIAKFDEAYDCYTKSIREELWQLIEEGEEL